MQQPLTSKELAMVACGLALLAGAVGVGYGVYLVIAGVTGEAIDATELSVGGVMVLGGLFQLGGAALLWRRRRSGRVLLILAAFFLLALPVGSFLVSKVEPVLAFAVFGAAVLAAVLAFLLKSWCLPKVYPQGWQQQGWQQQGQQPPGGWQQPSPRW